MASREEALDTHVFSTAVSHLMQGSDGQPLTENILTKFLFSLATDTAVIGDPDELLGTLMSNTPGLATRKVCQYQFKKNDIAWICKNCQSDETCVLCNACFQNSNHEGHEVYYYHSQAGGCCDCGDCDAWKPSGFCKRHGQQTHSDPLALVPAEIRKVGTLLLQTMISEMASYAQFSAAMLEASPEKMELIDDSSDEWSVIVHADDIHTAHEFVAELEHVVRAGPNNGLRIAAAIKKDGMVAIATAHDMDELQESVSHLRAKGFLVTFSSPKIQSRRSAMLVATNWICKLVILSDGMCRLVCEAFSSSDSLHTLLSYGLHLDKALMMSLHNALLSCMADQIFKENLAMTYANAYPMLAETWARGIGLNDVSFFSLSVQFLNRHSFVYSMVNRHNFFKVCMESLVEMLSGVAVINGRCENLSQVICINHRRYNPILSDLRVVFSIPTTNRRFVADCSDMLLYLFGQFQGMHAQQRVYGDHVEYETREWIVCFNFYIGLGGLLEPVTSWMAAGDAHINTIDETNSEVVLPCAQEFVLKIHAMLLIWLQAQAYDIPADLLPSMLRNTSYRNIFLCSGTNNYHFADGSHTFHLFLHRLFAASILESMKNPNLISFLQALELATFEELELTAARHCCPTLADHPLDCLTMGSEIRIGLWARNGMSMKDQLVNYEEAPYAKIFKDLDILCVQFFAGRTLTSPNVAPLILRIFHRFGILDYLDSAGFEDMPTINGTPSNNCMLTEEALALVIVMITELPQPPPEDICSRVLSTIRREIIHKLCAGPATFSQLMDTAAAVADHAKVDASDVEALIHQIAESEGAPSLASMEVPKLHLRPCLWIEYNPLFPRMTSTKHQECIERCPAVDKDCPMVPCPPQAHPCFGSLRSSLCNDSTLLKCIRLHCLAHAASFTKQGGADRYHGMMIHTPCRGMMWARILHALTLIAHNISECTSEEKSALADFLLEGMPLYPDGYYAELPGPSSTVSVFCSLLDIHRQSTSSKPDANNKRFLGWVIEKFAGMTSATQSYYNDNCAVILDVEARTKMLEKRKMLARQRSMALMQSRASRFAATIEDEDSDAESDTAAAAEFRPSGDNAEHMTCSEDLTCIICHSSETGERLGLQFMSVASRLCSRDAFRANEAPWLPSPDLQLEREKPRIFLSSCTHAMHFSCFDIYYNDVVERNEAQGGIIIDAKAGQFLCPFCKKMSNSLVPHYKPPSAKKRARPEETPQQTSDDQGLPNSEPHCVAEQLIPSLIDVLLRRQSASGKPVGPSMESETFCMPAEPERISFESGQSQILLRFLGSLTAPVNRNPLTAAFTMKSTSCAFWQRLEMAVSAVCYTVRCDMLKHVGPGYHIRSQQVKDKGGLDEHGYLSSVIGTIGACLSQSGSKGIFIAALLTAIAAPLTGERLPESAAAELYAERHPSGQEAFDWLHGFLLGLHRGVLSLPILDLLVLSLSAAYDSDDICSGEQNMTMVRVLSIASLVQVCIALIGGVDHTQDIHCDVEFIIDADLVDKMEPLLFDIQRCLPMETQPPSRATVLLILAKWAAFLRLVVQLIYRSKLPGMIESPDVFFSTPTGFQVAYNYVALLGLEPILLTSTGQSATMDFIERWISCSMDSSRKIESFAKRGSAPFDFPRISAPTKLLRLPKAYTQLHADIKAISSFECSAICLFCGAVLDGGGLGRVTRHTTACSGDMGCSFLLQESAILLLHGDRASYFPSPYVDEHGERQKLSRGKPLYMDERRYEFLEAMWLNHEISREVILKRSVSPRVIIPSHY